MFGHFQNEYLIFKKLGTAELGDSLHIFKVFCDLIGSENKLKHVNFQFAELFFFFFGTNVFLPSNSLV
jgi:hypothetical protein